MIGVDQPAVPTRGVSAEAEIVPLRIGTGAGSGRHPVNDGAVILTAFT
jgi:hypothetical protein